MAAYIARRLLLMIPTILGILLISFTIIQFAPGGPVERVLAQLQGVDQSTSGRIGAGANDLGANLQAASDIARATGASKKTVHRTAVREGWPSRQEGNRFEYAVPANIAAIIVARPNGITKVETPVVRFADTACPREQRRHIAARRFHQAASFIPRDHPGVECDRALTTASI